MPKLLLILCCLSIMGTTSAKRRMADWQEVRSVEELWQQYPERIRTVLAALDVENPALRPLFSLVEAGDTIAAAKALLIHYRKSETANWLLSRPIEGDTSSMRIAAVQMLQDTMDIHGVRAQIPHMNDAGWQWDYQGPEPDAEFGYTLNGHKYLVAFISAWQATHQEVYVQAFDRLIRDWIIHNPLPSNNHAIYKVLANTGLDWRDIDEVIWRTLEAGNRLGVSWPHAFYHFQSSDAFTPAARLLMLASIVEHAAYLQEYHKKGHNWTTMEMNGLALAGLTFPEFRDANEWANYAMQVMEQEINRQVYPDGLQTELSTKTQWVALYRFESLAENFTQAQRPVKASYLQRVEKMYAYLAYSLRPDGHQPLNNDSDREDLRPRLLKAAKKFQRPDWEWIATNGQSGKEPEGLPSIVFPWAGLHVMRSGWDAQAEWSLFDTGPFGTGHQHADMLHLSIAAYGKDLLVDGGRYTHKDYFSFDPTLWRGYFRSTFSHNTILIDGKGQNAGPLRGETEIPTDSYSNTPESDYAIGTFSNGYEDVAGEVSHTRAVKYIKGQYWIVVDQVETDRPRTVQTLWHYAPTCSVQVNGKIVQSTNPNEANLAIIPVGKTADSWELERVKGQEEPFRQGWYSADYGIKVPNFTAVYSQAIEDSRTFVWVLVPAKGMVPKVKVKLIRQDESGVEIRIRIGKEKAQTVWMPL